MNVVNVFATSVYGSFAVTAIVLVTLGATDVLPWWAVAAIFVADAACTAAVLSVRGSPILDSLGRAQQPLETPPPDEQPTIFEK